MADGPQRLTGIWHGLYSYPAYLEPVYFVATLISFARNFSGTTHEAVEGRTGAPLQLFASVEGSINEKSVLFQKHYDSTQAWTHSVNYDGTLTSDGAEIEGEWSIPGGWSGPFLMIRGQRISEQKIRRAFEKA
jgi:hypothetical protein